MRLDTPLELALWETGEESGQFRTQNDPTAPLQRNNITERKGIVDIRCAGVEVIHGFLEDGESAATLLVYDFQLDPRRKARRIVRADIEFWFSSEDGQEPEVLQIAPKGRMTFAPTTQKETITRGGGMALGGSVVGVQLNTNWKWEKTTSRETKDATTVVGSVDLKGRNYGPSNAVSWTLMENASMESGITAHFRTVVLLRRKDDEKFQSTFKIRAHMDLVGNISQLFGSTPKDDPILYEPDLPPSNNLRHYDVKNLGSICLGELCTVSLTSC